MKKKIGQIFLTFICLLLLIPTVIFAAWNNGGGTGSQGGQGGGITNSSNCSYSIYWQSGSKSNIEVGAYRFDLVYKEKNGGRQLLKTVVVQIPSRSYCTFCSNRSLFIGKTQEYVNALNATGSAGKGARYVTSGPLADLANRLLNGETVDSIFGPGGLDADTKQNTELIESYITSSEGFAMDEKEMMEEQDDNPGRLESYGYRIMIQKLQGFLTGCKAEWTNGTGWKVMGRKDAASNNAVKRYLVGNLTAYIAPYETMASSDLFTTRDDMGVRNANAELNIWRNSSQGFQVRGLAPNFADPNNGSGYNILWFSTKPFRDYDYTVDAVCANCNSNNADNIAYVIKDTSDWDAILNSSESDNSNVQGYYNKTPGGEDGEGVYCREEYTVYFPNAKDQIYVDPGRYFTINPSPDSWADFTDIINKYSISGTGVSTIPLMKPVKVKKKQECQANVNLEQGENESDEAFEARVHQAKMSALSSYLSSNESSFKNNMGTVYFRYNETYKDSKYNMNNPETFREFDKSHQVYESKLDDAAEMLTMEATSSYELPDNYYQYIRIRDGLSMKNKPSNADTEYKNVGIENLPVSFENHGTPITETVSKAADIQFAYDLPTTGTNISQAAGDDNFLATEDPGDNIYQQYFNGDYDEDVKKQLENSACAQMYGFGTANFDSCVRDRVKDKTPSGGNCISKSSIMGSTTSGYSCMVLTSHDSDDDSGCDSEEDAKKYGVDWNPISQVCCPEGTSFNPELGKCSPNDPSDPNDPDSGDPDGNPSGNTCRIENGKYYDFNGNEITKDEYDKICPSDVPPVCPQDKCPYGCCPSGECAPMPDGTCPGQGGIDVIYRTIDLEDPFPGQDAENRATGANWCSYNIKTQKIDCKYNNATSNNYIIRERSGHKYGSDVYEEDHVLYEITLDTETIKQIRDYNDDNKYDDDWIRACYQNGKACFSKFLRDGSIYSKLSGECKLVSGSNFYDCDEPV